MNIADENDVAKADRFLALNAALETGDEQIVRVELAATLDVTNPGWRNRQAFIDRIVAVGPVEAAKALLARYAA